MASKGTKIKRWQKREKDGKTREESRHRINELKIETHCSKDLIETRCSWDLIETQCKRERKTRRERHFEQIRTNNRVTEVKKIAQKTDGVRLIETQVKRKINRDTG